MERTEIVDGWLAIAARDLCPAAKERIALEITAHFNEAVAAHMAEGLPVLEAELLARQELGDAEAAGKRFRKRHLTVREFEFAEGKRKGWTIKLSRRAKFIVGSAFVVAAAIVWFMLPSEFSNFLVIFILSEALVTSISYRMARLPDEIAIRKLGIITLSHMLILLIMAGISLPLIFFITAASFFSVPTGYKIWPWIPIVFKTAIKRRDGGD